MKYIYDVIIIGGGHAGCEAASAAARMGANVALITHKLSTIGEMSCNPAFGGIAKGTVVREIDALGGLMGIMADKACIHGKILNYTKGPAVHGPRCQADRKLYKVAMQEAILNHSNLTVLEDEIVNVLISDMDNNPSINGVVGKKLGSIHAKKIIVTSGTFLKGKMYVGERVIPGGRVGEDAAMELSDAIRKLNFSVGRLNTGTPPRLDANTIDWSVLEVQSGDAKPVPFSYLNSEITNPQVNCHITYTNKRSHEVVRRNLDYSSKSIHVEGKPPRYCPSIETKLMRFAERESHRIFLEPEGLNSDWIYPNGISNSLPEKVQEEFIQSIDGLHNCKIMQYAYTVDYDYVDPRELYHTLETKKIKGLYFAGQINGTTGYEEAGGQGLVAGVNAVLSLDDKDPFILDRSEAYIGVMIDDLVTLGINDEPYRLFTSRAEYRISIRSDNADIRLTEKGSKYGLVSAERLSVSNIRKGKIEELKQKLLNRSLKQEELSPFGVNLSRDGLGRNCFDILRYTDVDEELVSNFVPEIREFDQSVVDSVKADSLYLPYLKRQEVDINLMKREEGLLIPNDVDYSEIQGLSNEVTERLSQAKPMTVGAARRTPGVTPAAIVRLLVHLKY